MIVSPTLARTSQKRKRASADEYTVAIIAPLAVELAPILAVLDTVHDGIATTRSYNSYTLGEIGQHHVVVVSLPSIGNNDSSSVATQLLNDFPSVKFGLLVGIGGGVPAKDGKFDIRLGDVVVSEAIGAHSAVIQFDRGKKGSGDAFEWTGHLNVPSPVLSSAVKTLRAQHSRQNQNPGSIIANALKRNIGLSKTCQTLRPTDDQLFETTYEHDAADDCSGCDTTRLVRRPPRSNSDPHVHHGPIGSSNTVIRYGKERERLREKFSILCVEMEAAGVMNILPCIVIRGICDYADSHKNKQWQPYAAATAAAYMKELLLIVPSIQRSVMPAQPSQERVDTIDRIRDEDADMPEEMMLRALISSLKFERMHARLHNIDEAYPRTCRWLFEDPLFQVWIDRDKVKENFGFLWIKGKPGCGKSTVTKTALAWLEQNAPREATMSYFFNARAPGNLEKSNIGLYRSMSHQLLSKCPGLKDMFLQRYKSKRYIGSSSDKDFSQHKPPIIVNEWTEIELKNFLYEAVGSLGENQPLNIVVDALDEGNEMEIRELISLLQRLASSAVDGGCPLRVLLSSRHYPQIRMPNALSLTLETHPGHKADVEMYIQENLDDELDQDFKGIRTRVYEKSQMTFLWVILVLPVLKRAYDRGRIAEMSQCLEDLPQDLENYFEAVLALNVDDIDHCHTLLRWVLFAMRPLTPTELYLAIQPYSHKSMAHQDDVPSDEIVSRFLTDTSRGLVEITTSTAPIAQFIHDSVRTFLHRRGPRQTLDAPDYSFRALSHDQLKRVCWGYIHRHQMEIDQYMSEQRWISAYQVLPFLEYARTFVLDHADASRASGISQNDFLQELRSIRVFRAPSLYVGYDESLNALEAILQRSLINLLPDFLRLVTINGDLKQIFSFCLMHCTVTDSLPILQALLDVAADCDVLSSEYDSLLRLSATKKFQPNRGNACAKGGKFRSDR